MCQRWAASTSKGLTAGLQSTAGEGVTPGDVTDIGRPSSSVDAGRKQSGMHKVEVVGGEGERPVQVVDLFDGALATILNNDDSGLGMVITPTERLCFFAQSTLSEPAR